MASSTTNFNVMVERAMSDIRWQDNLNVPSFSPAFNGVANTGPAFNQMGLHESQWPGPTLQPKPAFGGTRVRDTVG